MPPEIGTVSYSPAPPGLGGSNSMGAAPEARFSVQGTSVLEGMSRQTIDEIVGSGEELMLHAAELIQSFLSQAGFKSTVSVDQSAGAYVLKVQSSVSGELIRQIPSAEVLQVMRFLRNNTALEAGLLLNRQA